MHEIMVKLFRESSEMTTNCQIYSTVVVTAVVVIACGGAVVVVVEHVS